MPRLFSRLLEENSPKVNPVVMNNIACIYMKNVEKYIDSIFQFVNNSFPEGITYNGYERCSPYEEYERVTKIKNNKRIYDIAKSTLYLVKYKFSFNGEKIEDRYIYLPYVEEAGILNIGGPQYHITPVLSDIVISPGINNVFIRLNRDKLIFKRCLHSVIINNVREISYVIWSQIYRNNDSKKIPSTTKAMTSVAHYLFAKYGFTETFRKYADVTPVVGEEEINTDNYPASDWVICESSQIKPKTYLSKFYEPTNIKVAIPKDKWNNLTKNLIVSFFYIVDHFPSRFKPGYVDNTSLWMILLGHIIFSGLYGENKLYSNIEEHFMSIDHYVDPDIIEKLETIGYYVKDFYDLLAVLINIFNSVVNDKDNSAISMFGKNLEVLYYVLYSISSSIVKVNFKLNKLVNKKTPSSKSLTIKDVIETFNKNLKPGSIFSLSSGKIITESVSYSGDHKYFKLTSKISKQQSLPGGIRGKSKRTTIDENNYVDISMAEAGSLLYLPKKNPTPTNRINPFAIINIENGSILPNPKFEKQRNKTKKILNNKS